MAYVHCFNEQIKLTLIYSEEADLYIHHDILLSSYPICFEWLDYSAQLENKVNYVAVGDMGKEISIWDIDTVNTLEPVSKLEGHKDSVLDLSWNCNLRNLMASGSADKSVCVWNLENSAIISHFTKFNSIVQTIKFNPSESQSLLVGDNNGIISLIDCQSSSFKKWNIANSEIERVIWNHYNPCYCFASTSTGFVYCFDTRQTKKSIYSIKAHSDSVTGLALSFSCYGCLITASMDKTVKIWDVDESKAQFIHQISNLKMGPILSLSANPDLPFVIAVGGNSKSANFQILDISSSKNVSSHFLSRVG